MANNLGLAQVKGLLSEGAMAKLRGGWTRLVSAAALLLAGGVLHGLAPAARGTAECEGAPRPCVSVTSDQLVMFPSQSVSHTLTCPAAHPVAYKVDYSTDSGQVSVNQALNEQQTGSSNTAINFASGTSHYVTFYLECLQPEEAAQ